MFCPASSPSARTLPASAQAMAKVNSVSRQKCRSPPKAASASSTPAAAFTGAAVKNAPPGKNMAAAYAPPKSPQRIYRPRRSVSPASRAAERTSR